MAALNDLPVELLLKTLHLATHLDHPKAFENPLINWLSSTNILFKHTVALRRTSLVRLILSLSGAVTHPTLIPHSVQTAKASIALVCRQWNHLATPWLYEHIVIDNEAKLLMLTQALDTLNSRITRLATFVQRLDIELPLGISDVSYKRVARVLPAFDNLITLVMMLQPPTDVHSLLPLIPASLSHLLWSAPVIDMSMQAEHLFDFLDSHPRLQTFSHPFSFDYLQDVLDRSKRRTPYHSISDWVIRDALQLINFGVVQEAGLCPNVVRRTVGLIVDPTYIDIMAILCGVTTFNPPETPSAAHLAITELSLCILLPDSTWPPRVLADDLCLIDRLCPNLRRLNLTLNGESEDTFNSPMEPLTAGVTQVPQVTIISVQRIVNESEPLDSVGTPHHAICLPWRSVFPGLQAIRIREDVDLGEVAYHPTMAFVRDEGWDIRIEDRFGEPLM